MEKSKLTKEEKEFFGLVSRAAFCNPFSELRSELDEKISQCDSNVSEDEKQDVVIERVRERIGRLKARNRARIDLYTGEERYMMQNVFLFDIFHLFTDSFDRLILDQMDEGDQPCQVPFTSDAVGMMRRRGFSATEAYRFFSIFYQIRRGYYFIGKGLIGRSPCMKQLRLHLWNNVFTHDIRWYESRLWNRMEDFSTLLLGETGTGKGVAAAAIGRSGYIPYNPKKGCFEESFSRNFIPVNLSLFPEPLIESELFGHRKGSFTGAVDHHQGIFFRCSTHGSIFLDEIGDVSIPVQVKLLQVLQERSFTPVGSHQKHRFNGRVIAATNKPLDQLRGKGFFRDDFFYRLCSDVIVVPPLRQRVEEGEKELDDILSSLIVRLTGEESQELVELFRETIYADLGKDYPWPGNVRELEQAVRRILITGSYEGDIVMVAPDLQARLSTGIERGSLSAQEILSGYCNLLYQRFGTYEEVSRRAGLDRRTVKRYIQMYEKNP
jgi:DNA-binding NtrC family response regulator